MILAAIDIGSNAIRAVLVKDKVLDSSDKQNLILKKRFSLRLGTDVFQTGYISDEKKQQLFLVFKEIKDYFYQYKVSDYKINATSAFRDAKNGKAIAQEIKREFGLKVDIIDGAEEARIIRQSLIRRNLIPPNKSTLLMDIGGGSLEISILAGSEPIFSKSVNVGTLRIIEDIRSGQLTKDYFKQLDLIDDIFIESPRPKNNCMILGTGGNFRRIQRIKTVLLDKPNDSAITRDEIPILIGKLMDIHIQSYAKVLKIKQEHSSLVIPALLIIQRLLHYWPANEIVVPKISLNHGIIDDLLVKHRLLKN